MRQTVLLAASVPWPSIARLAHGFAATGARVEAFSPKGAPLNASRYVSRVHRYRPLRQLASLRRAIRAAVPDVLVSCDDRTTALLIRLHDREIASDKNSPVANLIATSLGATGKYGDVISRYRAMDIARELGIRVPETHPVRDAASLDTALDAIGLPAVLKADGSWGGDGVIVAKTREVAHAAYDTLSRSPSRLRSLVRTFRRKDPHHLLAALAPEKNAVCVQKFIPGNPAASAFACWKGKLTADISYDVLVADAKIGPPNVIRRIDDAEITRAATLIAAHFGLSGLHGLDFIRDEEGRVHLLEINPRATQGGTLAFGPGHDLPGALISSVTGKPTMTRPAIADDVVVLFPREWRRDPQSAWLKSGHHDLPWDDPAVFQAVLQS